MIDGFIYTRVSSREQEQEGFSLGAQARLLREYAERNGIRIVKRSKMLRPRRRQDGGSCGNGGKIPAESILPSSSR